jgi:Bifunctional DNA primase/polymerase, N-terminal
VKADLSTPEKVWEFFSNEANVNAFKEQPGGEHAYSRYLQIGWAPVLVEPKTRTAQPRDIFDDLIDEENATALAAKPITLDAVPNAERTEQREANGVVQADANGEFPTPADGAIWMLVTHGVPQTVLCGVDWLNVEEKKRGKAPFLPAWQRPEHLLKTPEAIREAATKYQGCNFGSVFNKDVFAFEADTPPEGVPTIRERFEGIGGMFTSPLMIGSSEGRGHRYYKWVEGVENIAQSGDATKHGDFSLRVSGEQCVSAGSIHPRTRKQYTVVSSGELTAPSAQEIAFWNSERLEKKSPLTTSTGERRLLKHGQLHGAYIAEAGRLWNRGYDVNDVVEMTVRWIVANSEDSVDEAKVRKEALNVTQIYNRGEAPETAQLVLNQRPDALVIPENAPRLPEEEETNPIPPFDPSVINGIYKKFVDLATRGTTLVPQFVFSAIKTVVGARMAGNVQLENLDVEPRYYTAFIGETGSGKGASWNRLLSILQAGGSTEDFTRIKIINGADSGAGIRDTFFEKPEDLPVLMYIDEVEGFGNKAAKTKNPEILDKLIELADSTRISKIKASTTKSKANKTKEDARLSAVMCGPDGKAYMSAFAGKTKQGLYDRLYPEFAEAVIAGKLPIIPRAESVLLLSELSSLDYSGTMTMSAEADTRVETFWSEQPPEVQKKVRWKKHLTLDTYMSAFGERRKEATLADVEIAIKIFKRQRAIREAHFTQEVPDRVGYYLGLIKGVTAKMERQLKAGANPALVARSRREYEKATNAHRDNEAHIFDRAWAVYAPTWLEKTNVQKSNGQVYVKYLPVMEPDE